MDNGSDDAPYTPGEFRAFAEQTVHALAETRSLSDADIEVAIRRYEWYLEFTLEQIEKLDSDEGNPTF